MNFVLGPDPNTPQRHGNRDSRLQAHTEKPEAIYHALTGKLILLISVSFTKLQILSSQAIVITLSYPRLACCRYNTLQFQNIEKSSWN